MKKYIGYIISMIIGGLITGSIGVVAYQMTAGNIAYTPSNNKWKVNNVGDAINDLHNMKTTDIYSEEEKVVGKWVNNKPIYQRTVETTSVVPGNNAWATAYSADWVNDIEMIVNIELIRGKFSAFQQLEAFASGNIIKISTRNEINNSSWLTIRYTKKEEN